MLTSKLPDVGTTIFTRMSALAAECGAINLSQGYPDFEAPPALCEALARAVRDYLSGHPGVRKFRAAEAAEGGEAVTLVDMN